MADNVVICPKKFITAKHWHKGQNFDCILSASVTLYLKKLFAYILYNASNFRFDTFTDICLDMSTLGIIISE